MNPPRRCRCLPAILAALALSCLASASAIAQTPPAPVLDLRNFSDINLILRFPVTTSVGKTYYYLDRNGNGNSVGNRALLEDGMTRYELQTLLNDGNGVGATQEGGHKGNDDARSVIVDKYTLILPTLNELRTLISDQSRVPPGWSVNQYYSSTVSTAASANGALLAPVLRSLLDIETVANRLDGNQPSFIAFQVLPRTITVEPKSLAVHEGITDAMYTVVLDAAPNADTTVNIARSNPSVETAPLSLTFTATNWNTPQSVTITVPDNEEVDTEPNTPILTHFAISDDYTSATLNLMVRDNDVPLAIDDPEDQILVIGQLVNFILPAATGGIGAVTYTLSGTIPGLSFNPANHTLSGSPTDTTTVPVPLTYTVTDGTTTATQTFTVTVFSQLALASIDSSLTYTVRQDVSLTLPAADGGIGPFTYTLSALPAGLTFNPGPAERTIRGMPSQLFSASLDYTVVDSRNETVTQEFELMVTPTVPLPPDGVMTTVGDTQIVIRWTAVGDGNPGYHNGGSPVLTYTATTVEGTTTFSCTATGHSATSCTITELDNGTEYAITLIAANENGPSTAATVLATPTLSLPTLATIESQRYDVRQPVLLTLPAAVGGIAPFTYTLTRTGGAMPVLPPGLSFNTDPTVHTISGASSLPFGGTGGAMLVYRVTDANAETTFQNFTLKVDETVPLAPTGVSAVAGDAETTVRWTAVPGGSDFGFHNGGNLVLSYTATARESATATTSSCTAFGHSATSCTIPNLTNGAEYTVTVIATNMVENSADSESDTLTLPLLTATGGFTESDATTGAVGGALTFTLLGDTFVTDVANHITVDNVPTGLTPVFVLNSPTLVTMTLGGTAINHADEDHDVTNLMVTFPATAVASGTAPPGASYTTGMIDFVDPIGITLAHPSQNIPALNIQEGETITYTARLDALPTGDVTVDITISSIDNPTDVTITPASLTFTRDNWRSPQTVTVMAEGRIPTKIRIPPP